ncbi:MAG: ketoacyl-ACP synthase III [Pseudomonadota bacterium]|nr:ketoacyl-ACP synthase III [Gammaproteobacteria bacterium]MDQ3583504.1 ketoacyl-ACP synthase III [Pseudomonadota bacterium]
MRYSRIAGTGGYLPERVLTNADLARMVDTTDEWIVDRTGVRKRHIAAEGETTCDLAEHASRRALEAAGVGPGDIDLVVVGTATPDMIFPSTACLLQERLDIHDGPAFDLQAVCTGFLYALDIADKFIRTGSADRALVVGAETFSRIVDWTDRSTCVLFGDGAGAVVIEAAEVPGIVSTHLHADGRYQSLLNVPSGVSRRCDGAGSGYIQMAGSEVFRAAVKALDRIVDETLAANRLAKTDIDWLVPHQANTRIIAATAKKLDLPMSRVVLTVEDHANTSAASVPLALDCAVRDGRIRRGELLLLEAFGGGFTWGSALVRY